MYVIKRLHGEMSERPKEHDWKSCVPPQSGTEGSNPSLSAIEKKIEICQALRNVEVTNPVRFGRKQR